MGIVGSRRSRAWTQSLAFEVRGAITSMTDAGSSTALGYSSGLVNVCA